MKTRVGKASDTGEKRVAAVGFDREEIQKRTGKWRPDEEQLDRLMKFNAILSAMPVPPDLCRPRPDRLPIVFVTGVPRSGSTIMLQSLANSFDVTYPDNITARFWGALHYGLSTSRSLQKQLGLEWPRPFDNDMGITQDPLGIHAVGYFWRRFFVFEDAYCFSTKAEEEAVDQMRLYDELAAMYRIGGERPLLFRSLYLGMISDLLAEILPNAIFIDMRRELTDVICSALAVRVRRYGDETTWWGMRPPEHAALRAFKPEIQVAGQFFHLRRRVDEALSRIPDQRRITVPFAEFRRDPSEILDQIRNKASAAGVQIIRREGVAYPEPFETTISNVPADSDRRERIDALLRFYESNPDRLAPDQNDQQSDEVTGERSLSTGTAEN